MKMSLNNAFWYVFVFFLCVLNTNQLYLSSTYVLKDQVAGENKKKPNGASHAVWP